MNCTTDSIMPPKHFIVHLIALNLKTSMYWLFIVCSVSVCTRTWLKMLFGWNILRGIIFLPKHFFNFYKFEGGEHNSHIVSLGEIRASLVQVFQIPNAPQQLSETK